MTTTAGLAQAWAATRADQRQQVVAVAALKQQAASDQALVVMLEQGAQASQAPPAPPGQGVHVDKRV
jgi:hypothetical protein